MTIRERSAQPDRARDRTEVRVRDPTYERDDLFAEIFVVMQFVKRLGSVFVYEQHLDFSMIAAAAAAAAVASTSSATFCLTI